MVSEPKQYRIFLKPAAERVLSSLSKKNRKLVARRIDALSANPRPKGVEKLAGQVDLYRVRAGDFRIIYQIQDAVLRVLVVMIGDRKDVYDRIKRLFE